MKLRNLKAHFILDTELNVDCPRKIFRDCNATFTIHSHHKNVVHVTGVKSNSHLKMCAEFIKTIFDVKILEEVIDNQFFSHKDRKIVDLNAIYAKISNSDLYDVVLEPELFPGLTIKHKNREFPTILLFSTGSYTLLGGKMKNIKQTNSFVKKLLNS